jgi:7-carboxy-7-deazaguanine synthase
MSDSLVVNEIYLSLQGESTWAGLPCIFVRLTACNLRCSYCDTAYAFTQGRRMDPESVLSRIDELAAPYAANRPMVELTGGEPLLQTGAKALMSHLCDRGYTVLVETSGAHEIKDVDARVHRIMDLKCPSSGETERMLWTNLEHLRQTDEVKFVIGSHEDYEWVARTIAEHSLADRCPLLLSWVHPLNPEQRDPSLKPFPASHHPIDRRELVERIVADALPVRFQVQLHKIIWPPDERGV